MKKTIQLTVFLISVLLYSGCKKDTAETPGIYGLWQVTSSQVPNLKFVKFNSNKTLDVFTETAEGFRGKVNSNFTPTTDQIVANLYGSNYYPTSVYNYTISGDVLTIMGDNAQVFITATKSTSDAPETWVKDVVSTDQINGLFSDNDRGIGYDGSNLLFSDYDNGKIIKVSLTTRTIAAQINAPNSINTIEYDGANYWVSRNGYSTIEKLDLTGTSIFTSTPLGPWLYGIGFFSLNSIICYSNNDNTLYKYDYGTNSLVFSKVVDDVPLRDIAISNGKVFIVANNLIYRLNSATFAVEATYRVTDAISITGIAAIATNVFWLNTQGGTKLLKVDLN